MAFWEYFEGSCEGKKSFLFEIICSGIFFGSFFVVALFLKVGF
jgi:hypothetical protein